MSNSVVLPPFTDDEVKQKKIKKLVRGGAGFEKLGSLPLCHFTLHPAIPTSPWQMTSLTFGDGFENLGELYTHNCVHRVATCISVCVCVCVCVCTSTFHSCCSINFLNSCTHLAFSPAVQEGFTLPTFSTNIYHIDCIIVFSGILFAYFEFLRFNSVFHT